MDFVESLSFCDMVDRKNRPPRWNNGWKSSQEVFIWFLGKLNLEPGVQFMPSPSTVTCFRLNGIGTEVCTFSAIKLG